MLIEIRRDVNRVTAFARDLGKRRARRAAQRTQYAAAALISCVCSVEFAYDVIHYTYICVRSPVPGKTALFGAVSPEGPCALSAASEERERDKKKAVSVVPAADI